ncbi:hypothetical protein Brsp01_51750 [Brucella sp. NBRC 12950]|nr:hypothetical protein Brsp01_51750 [Brucella sp. NBRC 12950]
MVGVFAATLTRWLNERGYAKILMTTREARIGLQGIHNLFGLVRLMTVVLHENAGSKAVIGHRVSNHGVHK